MQPHGWTSSWTRPRGSVTRELKCRGGTKSSTPRDTCPRRSVELSHLTQASGFVWNFCRHRPSNEDTDSCPDYFASEYASSRLITPVLKFYFACSPASQQRGCHLPPPCKQLRWVLAGLRSIHRGLQALAGAEWHLGAKFSCYKHCRCTSLASQWTLELHGNSKEASCLCCSAASPRLSLVLSS